MEPGANHTNQGKKDLGFQTADGTVGQNGSEKGSKQLEQQPRKDPKNESHQAK